jgi:hypothetical protein
VAPDQSVVVWQLVQSVEKPAAAWLGFEVPAWWHEAQSLGVPAYRPFAWQPVQLVVM